MIVRRKEIEQLTADIRRIIDGQAVDMRDNLEGRLSILKNDIHILAERLNEQTNILQKEKIALSNTLADISHQLKTPLTAMMVMVELLENAPPEKAAEFIINLKQGLNQTSWLVNSLLKMAKLDSGSVVFSPINIPVSTLLELALQPLQVLLDIKNQQVKLSGAGRSPKGELLAHASGAGRSPKGELLAHASGASNITLWCDKNWTAEALTNVIKNASEHSPEGSTIDVTAGENPLTRWVSVTDNGDGIPPTKIKGLFQRFGDSKQGTGIGLPLSLAIMQGQNGDIVVDGGGNKCGAVFTLKFYHRV